MSGEKPAAGGHPPTLLGGTAIKPKERKGLEAVRFFIHNPDTGEFFTRTPKSWALITIFYIIYYTILAAFWYGLLIAFFSTLPEDQPKFILDDSLIGSNPGLGIRPAQQDSRIDSSMILISPEATADQRNSGFPFDGPSNADWAARLNEYVKLFNETDGMDTCPEGPRSSDDLNKKCIFDITVLDRCSKSPYGYLPNDGNGNKIAPCILIKPNRLMGWTPGIYKDDDEIDNDSYLTEEAKRLLKQDTQKVYVDCQGENPFDREGLKSGVQMNYFPADQGIGMQYFPFQGKQFSYHNPTVALQLSDLDLGRLYHIECKFWAKGIRHNRKDRLGLVHFEVLLHKELAREED